MQQPEYFVIFRTCDAVQALRGTRPFGLDKRSLVKICFLSLYESLKNYPHRMHILGDQISPELESFFRSYMATDKGITLSNGRYGNDDSIRASIQLALEQPDDTWVYLCEDDYLHAANAFEVIDDLVVNSMEVLAFNPSRKLWKIVLGDSGLKPLVIHPADYPDRYLPSQRSLSLLFLGKRNHWRQINYTTFTVLAKASTFKRYSAGILASAEGANDARFSRALLDRVPGKGKALGLSPIPGIATHMHENVMTPLVDWTSRAHELEAKLRSKAVQGN